MNVELDAFEADWIRKSAHSAIRSLMTVDKARLNQGRNPQYGSRIAKLTELTQKLEKRNERPR